MGYAILLTNKQNPQGKVTWVQVGGSLPQTANRTEESVVLIPDNYALQLLSQKTKKNIGRANDPIMVEEFPVSASELMGKAIPTSINIAGFLNAFEGSKIDEALSKTTDVISLTRLPSAFTTAMQTLDLSRSVYYFNRIIAGLPSQLPEVDQNALVVLFQQFNLPLTISNNKVSLSNST